MFALGIGSGVDTSQLRQIASSNDNVFTSPGFNELESVVKQIVEKTCPSKCSSTSKRGLPSSRSLSIFITSLYLPDFFFSLSLSASAKGEF